MTSGTLPGKLSRLCCLTI